jgi:hypothetical protein
MANGVVLAVDPREDVTIVQRQSTFHGEKTVGAKQYLIRPLLPLRQEDEYLRGNRRKWKSPHGTLQDRHHPAKGFRHRR